MRYEDLGPLGKLLSKYKMAWASDEPDSNVATLSSTRRNTGPLFGPASGDSAMEHHALKPRLPVHTQAGSLGLMEQPTITSKRPGDIPDAPAMNLGSDGKPQAALQPLAYMPQIENAEREAYRTRTGALGDSYAKGRTGLNNLFAQMNAMPDYTGLAAALFGQGRVSDMLSLQKKAAISHFEEGDKKSTIPFQLADAVAKGGELGANREKLPYDIQKIQAEIAESGLRGEHYGAQARTAALGHPLEGAKAKILSGMSQDELKQYMLGKPKEPALLKPTELGLDMTNSSDAQMYSDYMKTKDPSVVASARNIQDYVRKNVNTNMLWNTSIPYERRFASLRKAGYSPALINTYMPQ